MYMLLEAEVQSSSSRSLSLSSACSCLGVSRSGFYAWRVRPQLEPQMEPFEMKLKHEIQKIALEFPCYGYRRIAKELQRRDFFVNHKRILRLMREDNLLCLKRSFKHLTTDSNHGLRVYPNLAQNMVLTGINQLWMSDITYIHLQREFIYLAVIIDVFSRKCIGWELERHLRASLPLGALQKALETRWHDELDGLVHHSDRGVQYASTDYIACLKDHNIQISMSRKGNPYDGAFIESFIKTLKYEEVYLKDYETFFDAYDNLAQFLEQVYNEKRLHSSLGYLPPSEFEDQLSLNMRIQRRA